MNLCNSGVNSSIEDALVDAMIGILVNVSHTFIGGDECKRNLPRSRQCRELCRCDRTDSHFKWKARKGSELRDDARGIGLCLLLTVNLNTPSIVHKTRRVMRAPSLRPQCTLCDSAPVRLRNALRTPSR
jgi:hypothetical protein